MSLSKRARSREEKWIQDINRKSWKQEFQNVNKQAKLSFNSTKMTGMLYLLYFFSFSPVNCSNVGVPSWTETMAWWVPLQTASQLFIDPGGFVSEYQAERKDGYDGGVSCHPCGRHCSAQLNGVSIEVAFPILFWVLAPHRLQGYHPPSSGSCAQALFPEVWLWAVAVAFEACSSFNHVLGWHQLFPHTLPQLLCWVWLRPSFPAGKVLCFSLMHGFQILVIIPSPAMPCSTLNRLSYFEFWTRDGFLVLIFFQKILCCFCKQAWANSRTLNHAVFQGGKALHRAGSPIHSLLWWDCLPPHREAASIMLHMLHGCTHLYWQSKLHELPQQREYFCLLNDPKLQKKCEKMAILMHHL